MNLRLGDMAGWTVEPPSGVALVEPLADLRAALPPGTGDGVVALTIQAELGVSWRVRAEAGRLAIAGRDARCLADALYGVLEMLGVLWPEPGTPPARDEDAPGVPGGTVEGSPLFPERTLILGQDALHDDWRDWIPWASRNRYTAVFFHDTPPSRQRPAGTLRPPTAEGMAEEGGGWMFERFDADGDAIRAALVERGMGLVFGGHHLAAMLPREEFDAHPEWFTLRDGRRDPRHNLCTSAPGAIATLQANVTRFVERFPGARTYHFWADDIRGGGWCACPACEPLTPSDQALRATNAVAEAVRVPAPGATVAHLAYHDTVQPPGSVVPAPGVDLLWAPRERCYAHAINDSACRNAVEYWAPYSELLTQFPGRVQLFEYYSDAILFKGLAPPHLAILPADARAYAASGATEYQDLMVGDRPWVGPPWHAWFFPRAAEGADGNLAGFCRAAFGAAAPAAERWYRATEDAYRLLLDLHDLEPAPRHDVLDFSDSPRETLQRKAEELLAASDQLEEAALALAGASAPPGAAGERLAREQDQAVFVTAVSRHLAGRVAGWSAALAGRHADARVHLEDARHALGEVEAWDAAHNTPAYGNITIRMRQAMAYHTGRVERLL